MDALKPVNTLMETKAAGSLGNLLFGIGTYFGLSFMLYDNKKESIPKYEYPGMCGESMSVRTSDNVNLTGHLFWPESTKDRKSLPLVIHFHGRGGSIGKKLEYISNFVNICNCNILIFGYRGYTKSQGHPSGQGLKKDAEAILSKVFSTLGDKANLDKVIVHGKSLGGGPASYIVSQEQWRNKIRAVILDITFNSIDSLITQHISCLSSVANHIFANETWNVVEAAKAFREDMPVLIIGVVDDQTCPYQHSVKLHETLKSLERQVKLLTFDDGGHRGYWIKHRSEFFNSLKLFIDAL